MPVSGHGATLGFGTTTGFTPQYTSIGGFGVSRQSLDTTHLGTTGVRTKIGGDVYDVSPFSAPFFMDPDQVATGEDCAFDDILFTGGTSSAAPLASQTVTLTYPNAGATTFAGSAHVTGVDFPELATDTLAICSITVQYDDMPAIAE